MGIIGLQTSLPLVVEQISKGKISRKRAFESMTSGPAKAFGLDTGTLRKGAPADVVIIDPSKRWTFSPDKVASMSKNSPFLGREVQGAAETVLVAGRIVVRQGELA